MEQRYGPIPPDKEMDPPGRYYLMENVGTRGAGPRSQKKWMALQQEQPAEQHCWLQLMANQQRAMLHQMAAAWRAHLLVIKVQMMLHDNPKAYLNVFVWTTKAIDWPEAQQVVVLISAWRAWASRPQMRSQPPPFCNLQLQKGSGYNSSEIETEPRGVLVAPEGNKVWARLPSMINQTADQGGVYEVVMPGHMDG